jgi:hypothetical protein
LGDIVVLLLELEHGVTKCSRTNERNEV